MTKIEKEWWLKLAEEMAGRSLDEFTIEVDFPEVGEGETIIIKDLAAEMEMSLGIRFAFMMLKKVWANASDEVTANQLRYIVHLLEAMDAVFWEPIQLRYPKSRALGIRLHEGKVVIAEYENKEGDNSLGALLLKTFKF